MAMFGKIWDFKYAFYKCELKSKVVKPWILYAKAFESVVSNSTFKDFIVFKKNGRNFAAIFNDLQAVC